MSLRSTMQLYVRKYSLLLYIELCYNIHIFIYLCIYVCVYAIDDKTSSPWPRVVIDRKGASCCVTQNFNARTETSLVTYNAGSPLMCP